MIADALTRRATDATRNPNARRTNRRTPGPPTLRGLRFFVARVRLHAARAGCGSFRERVSSSSATRQRLTKCLTKAPLSSEPFASAASHNASAASCALLPSASAPNTSMHARSFEKTSHTPSDASSANAPCRSAAEIAREVVVGAHGTRGGSVLLNIRSPRLRATCGEAKAPC
jgi:hypothetical protein